MHSCVLGARSPALANFFLVRVWRLAGDRFASHERRVRHSEWVAVSAIEDCGEGTRDHDQHNGFCTAIWVPAAGGWKGKAQSGSRCRDAQPNPSCLRCSRQSGDRSVRLVMPRPRGNRLDTAASTMSGARRASDRSDRTDFSERS